jgi:hypothetical protein
MKSKRKRYLHKSSNENCEAVHRQIWRAHFGEIPKGSYIHHKDGDTLNNVIENLELVSPRKHNIIHHGKWLFEKNGKLFKKCRVCGKSFEREFNFYKDYKRNKFSNLCKKCSNEYRVARRHSVAGDDEK